MSDEALGAGQGALPPREDSASRPTVRYTQVSGGQYLFTQSPHNIPAIQITGSNVTGNATLTQGGVTRIINLSPVRNQASSIRPSLTNQSIVNALTKPRTTNSNIRLQIFSGGDVPSQSVTPTTRSPVKRSLSSTPEKKDTYSTKLQRVMNHRNVRSKIVKEKHNEHLLECHYLEIGGNILDLYQYAKRPKTQQFLNYLKENAIDPKEHIEDVPNPPSVVPPTITTPSATSASSLPGISHSSSTNITSVPTTTQQTSHTPQTESTTTTPKNSNNNNNKNKSSSFPSGTNQEHIVEKARQEAYVVQRISDLQKEGLWSEKRLPKVQELARSKAHWDFLLEEMVWLAADFAQERKWKKAAAKKCARMVQKYFQDKALAAQKAERAQEQHIRRIAAFCAKEIKTFWNNVEKLVEYKQNTRLEEKRKKALDQHLSFIVDQTEKYSLLLAEGMNKPGLNANESAVPPSNASSRSESRANSDEEFRPDSEHSTDDEETIAQAEATNKEEESDEVAALQRESEMDFESFLNELPKDYLENRDKIKLSEDEHLEDEEGEAQKEDKSSDKKKDDDFVADTSSGEDNEDTIQEQEEAEGSQDHQQELDDLQAENEMSIEELRKRYSSLPPISEDTVMSTSSTEEQKLTEDEDDVHEDNDGDVEMSSDDGSIDEVMSKGSDELEDDNDEDDDEEEEEEEEAEEEDEVGLKSLLGHDDVAAIESQNEGEEKKTDNNDLINDAAAIAESIQPKGNTLSSTSVVTPVPFLLKLPLREYQHIGLDWLVTMFERKLNGILADEMGLGKTIQTIALLAHLACEKENWGPHLIIVPTSVMLNWEMECKKWCPAFKILTYYGTQKERKLKRTGWTKPNAFHICITSYKLVIQDHQSFRRKKWKYLILDEAQNIKNFKSQRWQLLLNFQTQQRLLLTGTPLQNNLMELWSLMHFLMPNVFQSHREFKEWFSNPVTGMIEGNSEYNESIIKRLHKVLRPFLLRRLKSEVEKQMPRKYEHIIMCRLSKRQRFLYDDYMSRAKTRETLASGNLLSVINVLMQLRKVCNHPNLFEVRPTISPFHCEGIVEHVPSMVYNIFEYDPYQHINLESINLNLLQLEFGLSAYQCYRTRQYQTPKRLIEEITLGEVEEPSCPPTRLTIRVRRLDPPKEIKSEPKEDPKLVNTNMKLKVGSGVQLIQQGIQVSQASTSQSTGANLNLASVLKSSDKVAVPTAFAQLVQTSTGKHILFTPSCISTSNLGNLSGNTTVMTSGGQRLTVLSQSPSTPANNQQQTLTKAVVKVQLNPVPAVVSPTMNSTSEIKFEDRNNVAAKTVTSKYLEKLYANQSTKKDLDVRWSKSIIDKEEKRDSQRSDDIRSKVDLMTRINAKRCNTMPLYGEDFRKVVKIDSISKSFSWSNGYVYCSNVQLGRAFGETTNCLSELVFRPADRIEQLRDVFNRYIVYVPPVHAPEPEIQVWNPPPSTYWGRKEEKQLFTKNLLDPTTILHPIVSAMVTQFPDPRLIQYDCGKLQTLDKLLRKLKSETHRVLIFTQMTKMLDVLEAFLNFHGHIYLRLDGTTKVDQRQILMERFNGDKRIFVFILSTRSGGIGVNLTGADTVIFYDSDWNPTMDAQAQDRCHRIGQTRDVHIYRLISERTIEENILKKANQKRLLGDLAIEGGNFTTAYFKSSTIQDLFSVDASEGTAASRMSEVVESNMERERHLSAGESSSSVAVPDDKAAMGALENALAACEDDQDVQAARTAKAEAVADLAEFDENIPLDEQEKEKEPEMSKAEQEVENLIKQLSPIERYAMRFIEQTEAAWSAEQLAHLEREIEEKKLEWERNRLAAMKEEEERRARELEEESELLTFSREDATNQVWVSDNTMEQMPMWCPPTPPQQDTDVYIDQTMTFLYDMNVMTEMQLPPVYVKKENKRSRHEAGLVESRRALKIHRKDDSIYAPRSLFERPSPALVKIRRDLKLQRYRGIIRTPVPIPGVKLAVSKPTSEPPCFHNWTIHEDLALLKVIQSFQGLPLNLMVVTPGHTPNWDFVADYVNTVSITYRSPKQCRNRYETVLIPREEGKQVFDASPRKKKLKGNLPYKFPMQNKSGRPMRTSQLYAQDNNSSFSQCLMKRYDALKLVANKRTSGTKTIVNNPNLKNPKHAAVLNECGIDLDHPVLPVEVAARRAERIAREKKAPEQQQLAAQRLLIKGTLNTSQGASVVQGNVGTSLSGSSVQVVTSPLNQVTLVQTTTAVTTVTTTVITTPSTPPSSIKTQRIVASPMQGSTVSVSGLCPTQLQGTQRLIVTGTPAQAKAVVGGTATVSGKSISPSLQMIRHTNLKQHLATMRLQNAGIAGAQIVKTTTVSIAGQSTLQLQFTQAQPRAQVNYVKPGTVAIGAKQGITRTVTESEMSQYIKQRHLQQQKALAAVAAAGTGQATTIQSLSPQGFVQTIQQAGTSGTQVATLVKAVSSSGVTQTVTIPVTGVTLGQVKALAPGTTIKTTTPQQIRHIQFQQQLLAQKKHNQKIAGIAQMGKGAVATQLIVGSKPFQTPISVQQFIKSPLTVQQGSIQSVVLKGSPRVIPVNAAQGNKPTIQVVAATSQGITTTIRPQTASSLAGALTSIKMPANVTSPSHLLSQVSAALQGQNVVRQSSPIRIQTGTAGTGTPIVAVSVQSGTSNQSTASPQANVDKTDQVSRLLKK